MLRGIPITSLNPAINEPNGSRPLRLWPGVVIVALQWLVRFVVPLIVPDAGMFAVLGGIAGGLLILAWWLFFSRASWNERVGAIVLMVLAVLATKRIVHPSIANGMMGMMVPIYSIPVLSLALVGWAVASRRLPTVLRRTSLVGAIVVASAVMTLLRTDGLGSNGSDLHWRWTKTAEERLLAEAGKPAAAAKARAASASPAAASAAGEPQADKRTEEKPAMLAASMAGANTKAQWSSFRGPQRDGVIRGTRIATDWSRSRPVELWRRRIGPGWSSFAVDGDFVYTQEQRGEDEIVSCYNLATGAPVWSHSDAARFWESNGGAGPRGTPTLSHGRVYAFGATGIMNALDARDGSVIWSRNAASDTGNKIPGWGFSSSPLVIDDMVVIATGGVLAAYDAATGKSRWIGPKGGWGYSSPHLATIGGVAQILLLNGAGAISVAPADGMLLWSDEWKSDGIVQPAVLADGNVLLGSGSGLGVKVGVRRLAVTPGSSGWRVEERWTSNRLKPYFNDFVVHKGHAYGFDGSTLACIDLADGQRKWKGGRYGSGQLVLLADQDLLLVLSEQGELALARATPDPFTELSRFPALEGKTWNHPVLAGDVLLVRNDREMAAFRLP
ncbi:MAG: PQQ-like beta-propeller repeat protein [Opitutaceae bacterium]|nr:PQQ-like beta-propeller repeat protein [Opitutaceae bacterium]